MSDRNLHQIAERVLREVGQLDSAGYMTEQFIDVDHVVEVGLGLQVVGSSQKGRWRLPSRRLGALDLDHRKVVVNSKVMDCQGEEPRYRQILAHEAAHAVLHADHSKQYLLPFDEHEVPRGPRTKLGFSHAMKGEIEQEANTLGALLLIPEADMLVALAPPITRYFHADWALTAVGNRELEQHAALEYQTSAVSALCERFMVTESVAKIALDYWRALSRPPHSWGQRLSLLEPLTRPAPSTSGEEERNRSNFVHFGRNFRGNMRVIAFRRLKEFYESPGRGDAEQPLRAWFKEAEQAKWTCWADIKTQYATADSPGNNRVVFNIGGNKYRLIVLVDYQWGKSYVRWIGTHAEYDKLPDVRKV